MYLVAEHLDHRRVQRVQLPTGCRAAGAGLRRKYYDFDLYGTVNFTDHIGAQAGYRSFDVFYKVKQDNGTMNLRGLYFGAVARF